MLWEMRFQDPHPLLRPWPQAGGLPALFIAIFVKRRSFILGP